VTQRILNRSQIGEEEVKERATLHPLCIYDIVIRSELKYLIGANVLSLQNYENCQKTVGSVRFGF